MTNEKLMKENATITDNKLHCYLNLLHSKYKNFSVLSCLSLLMVLVLLAEASPATAATLNQPFDNVETFNVPPHQEDTSCTQIYGTDWNDVAAFRSSQRVGTCTHILLGTAAYTPGSSPGRFLDGIEEFQSYVNCNGIGAGWEYAGGWHEYTYCAHYANFDYTPGDTLVSLADGFRVMTGVAEGVPCSDLLGPGWESLGYDSSQAARYCKHRTTFVLGVPPPPKCTDTPPTAPALVSPANGATNQPASLTLDWENPSSFGTRCAGNQNNFVVFLEAGDSTPDTEITSDTGGFSQFTVSGLTIGKTYFWKVRATNGALSTDSEVRSFTVGTAAVETTASQTLYCRSDSKFVTDLDTPESRTTCESAGFKWTGTKCCSEDDDNLTTSTLREFYNDIGGTGGCWNSTFVESISFVKGLNDSVLNFGGEFHGCAIDRQNYNTENDVFLGIADKHAGDQLIRNHEYCFNALDNTYYCSYTEKWLLTDGADKTHLSFVPIEQPKQSAECCAQKECWNGEQCIQNQREKPLELPIGSEQFEDGFRCIDGTWKLSALRFTPDRSLSGYCPIETQCLLDPHGKIEPEQCINSTKFVEDNYCDNGNWSTRTKLLALELSGFISGDYALFCDIKENALNTIQYLIPASEAAADSLAKFNPNNFCVLKSGGKVVSAVSINKNIEEVPANSLQVFGVTSCQSGLTDDGNYHPCDSTNKVWYNKRLKSIIYSNTAIVVASDQTEKDSFEEFLETSLDNAASSIKRLVASPPFDESYLNISKKMDRLYASSQFGRTVVGTIEGTQFKNEIISYTNFDSNICDSTNQFNQAKKDSFSGVLCANELKNYYVLAQGSQFTNLNPESIWQDLTSKLRFK